MYDFDFMFHKLITFQYESPMVRQSTSEWMNWHKFKIEIEIIMCDAIDSNHVIYVEKFYLARLSCMFNSKNVFLSHLFELSSSWIRSAMRMQWKMV